MKITHNSDVLEVPDTGFGSAGIMLNGQVIPSARIWNLAASYLARGEITPRDLLFKQAQESAVFCWRPTDMLVQTQKPKDGDELLKYDIYKREERQRIRPLVDRFDLRIAKLEEPSDINMRHMHEVAEGLGFSPVGYNDGRVFYAEDPEEVFRAFGSNDWARIGVMCKRPGSSSVSLDLR